MTLLNAFAESRNIPALKLADRYGIRKVIETAHNFGITSNIPVFLPVAIGSADITLAEQVSAYSVFPNDGIRIEPRYIRKVTQADGLPLDATPSQVSEVISVETARTMMQFLQAVVRQGTGASASQLKHPLGGKTGTTNDFTDAWFVGFSPSVTCGTWIGFDDRESLGEKETGARAALPMWMDFMRAAIANKPNETFPTAGAPKKKLDVPLSGVADAAKPVQPLVPKQVEDPDASGGEGSQRAVPAAAAPAEEKPKVPDASHSVPQAFAVPARRTPAATAPAPAEENPKVPDASHSVPQAFAVPARRTPAAAAPRLAEVKPRVPEASRSISQAIAVPARTAMGSSQKPTNERSGVSNPPPDIY
jgi:penicillin-binding protein 1A